VQIESHCEQLIEKGLLCTLHRVYDQYGDVAAIAVAAARVIASLSVHTEFHADIFAAGKSTSLLLSDRHCSLPVTQPKLIHQPFEAPPLTAAKTNQ